MSKHSVQFFLISTSSNSFQSSLFTNLPLTFAHCLSGQEEKGTTEDEMVGWHHRLNGYGFGWTPGVGDEQGGLACCGSWGRKSRTGLSNWTELNLCFVILLLKYNVLGWLWLHTFFFFPIHLGVKNEAWGK